MRVIPLGLPENWLLEKESASDRSCRNIWAYNLPNPHVFWQLLQKRTSSALNNRLLPFPTELLERQGTSMFEQFYGLSQTPFSRDIPTSQLYQSLMLEETLGRLEYAAQRQLFAVVTGDCGTGKTTTIRLFRDSLDPAKFIVMYLADSKLTPRHFYKGLLEQLGCESVL
jgi:hypothetical protein